ncbi:MAG: rubrerythrin family protein [Anaerolineae bacterium]
MKEMTLKNLLDAFAGESQAHMKYLLFAELAEREKLPNVARLFRAASYSEQIHATSHLRALGVGKTLANLEAALAGETYEITTMYPQFIAVAEEEEEKRARASMEDAMAAEKVHAQLYTQAREAVANGQDVTLPKMWVCSVCGYTMEGDEPPDNCPICNALKKFFREF